MIAVGARFSGLRDDEHGAGRAVNDWGARDPDLRHDVAGPGIARWHGRNHWAREETPLPELGARVGVDRIDAIVLRSHKGNIMGALTGDGKLSLVKRRRINVPVHRL